MAVIARKQLTGSTQKIKEYAGHEGQLVFDKQTKHLHVLSGTAGKTTELANKSDIPAPQDISGKADKTYVDTQLATKEAKGTAYSKVESDSMYATLEGLQKYQITVDGTPAGSNAFSKSVTDGKLSEYRLEEPGGDTKMVLLGADENIAKTTLQNILAGEHFNEPYYVRTSGNRGTLAGWEVPSSEVAGEVTHTTPDNFITISDSLTIKNSDSSKVWVKIGAVAFGSQAGITLESKWSWVGGKAPEIKASGLLIVVWLGDMGFANYIAKS